MEILFDQKKNMKLGLVPPLKIKIESVKKLPGENTKKKFQ